MIWFREFGMFLEGDSVGRKRMVPLKH